MAAAQPRQTSARRNHQLPSRYCCSIVLLGKFVYLDNRQRHNSNRQDDHFLTAHSTPSKCWRESNTSCLFVGSQWMQILSKACFIPICLFEISWIYRSHHRRGNVECGIIMQLYWASKVLDIIRVSLWKPSLRDQTSMWYEGWAYDLFRVYNSCWRFTSSGIP